MTASAGGGNGSSGRWPRGAQRLAANVAALLSSTVITRATRFAIYAMVGRSLGAADLGRLAIAVALLQLIGRICVVGLPALATREVAADRETTGAFLVSGGLAIVLTTTAGYGVLVLAIAAMGYEAATSDVIWLFFVGLIPFGLSQLSEAILVGLERAKYVAYVNVPVNLSSAIVVAVLLHVGYGVRVIALSLGLEFLAVAAIQAMVIAIRVRPTFRLASRQFAKSSVRSALPFLGMASADVIRSSAGPLIISAVMSATAVGIFAAATQLQIPLRLSGQAVGTAVFPAMVRAWARGADALRRSAGRMLDLVVIAVLPAATGLVLVAPDALRLVYGSAEFADGVTVMRLLSVGALAMAIASILGRAQVAAGREIVSMRISMVNTATLLVASVFLTSAFGIVGAASAATVVAFLNIAQHVGPAYRLLGTLPVSRTVWRPIAASALMAVVVVLAGGFHVIVSVVVGALTYVAALATTFMWTSRSPSLDDK